MLFAGCKLSYWTNRTHLLSSFHVLSRAQSHTVWLLIVTLKSVWSELHTRHSQCFHAFMSFSDVLPSAWNAHPSPISCSSNPFCELLLIQQGQCKFPATLQLSLIPPYHYPHNIPCILWIEHLSNSIFGIFLFHKTKIPKVCMINFCI